MRYKIKSWNEYQHYKDRCPPWIKLHHSLLTSESWVMCNDASRALAIACMFLASRNKDNDGTFNGDPSYIQRFGYLNSKPDFKQLIEYGFLEVVQDASNSLAKCDTEKRREETEGETEKKPLARAFMLPDWINREHWELWLKTRKGKKMIPDQMQAQVNKLAKWRDMGLDYNKALADAATAGWQGLFEPKPDIPKTNSVQEARLDIARQIFGDKNGTKRTVIDITPQPTTESDGEGVPKNFLGIR